MMRRTQSVLTKVAFLATTALAVAACGSGPTAAEGPAEPADEGATEDTDEAAGEPNVAGLPQVTWNAATTFGSRDLWMTQLYDELADRVEEQTDGQFVINITLAGELGIESADFLPALDANRIQMAELFTGHQSGQIPHLGLFGLPFLMSGLEDAKAVGDAVRGLSTAEFEQYGVTPIAEYLVPGVHLWSSRPVEDITNWDGLAVRAFDETSANVVEELNGSPVVMGGDEVYEAIGRGVVEGGLTSTGSALALSWDEVAPNGYILNLSFPYVYIGISQAAYEELPTEYQSILMEEAERINGRFQEEFANADEGSNEAWLEAGGQLTDISSEDEAVIKENIAHLWQEWADETGLTAQDAMDAALDSLGLK